MQEAFKRARQSQLQAESHSSSLTPQPKSGSVASRQEASEADVHTWLSDIHTRRGDDKRLV